MGLDNSCYHGYMLQLKTNGLKHAIHFRSTDKIFSYLKKLTKIREQSMSLVINNCIEDYIKLTTEKNV